MHSRSEAAWETTITVAEPLVPEDQVEIRCPDVVSPGEYFSCHIDAPRGSGLNATVEMTDDVSGGAPATFGPVVLGDYWSDIPGGEHAFASYAGGGHTADTSVNSLQTAGKGYVLLESYFGTTGNVSQVEFVPVTTGKITIELVTPVCGAGLNWCHQVSLMSPKFVPRIDSPELLTIFHTTACTVPASV